MENVTEENSTKIVPNKIYINPDREKLMNTPVNAYKKVSNEKSNYKAEKNAKLFKKLNKTNEYKNSYKTKENNYNNGSNQGSNHGTYDRSNHNDASISLSKLDLCDDLILIIKDKIKNDKIELTLFERKTVNKFITSFEIKEQPNNTNQTHNSNVPQTCNTGDRCIVWYCKFTHSDARNSECKCSETECDKLHQDQAICKNPGHPDNCKMAHKISEVKPREL